MRVTTVSILVLIAVACCNAQQKLLSERISVVTDVHNGVPTAGIRHADPDHLLVTLKQGVSIPDAERAGIDVVRTLSDNIVIARNTIQDIGREARLVEGTQVVNYLWKLSDNLIGFTNEQEGEYVIVSKNAHQLVQAMRSKNYSVIVAGQIIRVQGNLSEIARLTLPDHEVTYLGKESFTAKEESAVLDLYLGPNKISQLHHHYPGLQGENIVISLKERQYNKKDIDLRGRHVPSALASIDSSDHATEMATIIAGAGNSFITGRGVASHARITSSSFSNMFPDDVSDFASLNSFLQNHSYGTVVENFYGTLANAYDEHAYDNAKILHVFSSGNSGTSTATSGIYVNAPGYANLTGNAKMAKNILVVGSVDTTGNTVAFSSRGPANDGRIKPELVAYSSVGTSNSAALVSGVAALLQQAFKNQTNTYPEAALLKAIIVNAAEDAGPPGIDFITGFGNLNAYRAMNNLIAGRYLAGSVNQGQTKTFPLNVPATAKNLKITLVWNDPPGAVNSANALINNLNLSVSSSGGTVLPWVLNTSPASLSSAPTRGVDNKNNIEQVSIDVPDDGLYTISVQGSAVAAPGQNFFIAYQWDIDNAFSWSYPTGSDNFPYNGESGTYFFWKSTLAGAKGDLEVTTNGGSAWTTIASQLDLNKGYYRWRQPFPINAVARARMKVASAYYETADFTISRTFLPSLGFSCGDTVLLQWNTQENVYDYQVKMVAGNYPSQLLSQADTSVVVSKNADVINYFIQPIHSSGKALLRSPSINIETFGAGCFITSFIDERISEEGILLRLGLGTTYGVTEVIFEHEQASEFVAINNVPTPDENAIRFLHDDPIQGLNRYRARVRLVSGQEVVSDTIQNYFISKTPFIVFPNPVKAPNELSVYSGRFEKFDFTFDLFNANGQKVLSADLRSDREFISTKALPPGLYLYRIHGQTVDTAGRIIVE